MTDQSNCPCDCFVHPRPLRIDAGLPSLPRQIATFSEFRSAMLAALPRKAPLAAWRARGDEDLGVMLLEMWAYVCDVVAFYDETIANETYLGTARLPTSARKLVGLIGYLPRPAVAASVHLAARIEGRLPVTLPAGLAFRSSAFGAEPPQVFELEADTRVHPLLNGWPLAPVRPATVAAGTTKLLLAPDTARAKAGDQLVVLANGAVVSGPHLVRSVARITAGDGARYTEATLADGLQQAVTIAGAGLMRATATTGLWTNASDSSSPLSAGSTNLLLSGVVPQIAANSFIVATCGDEARTFKLTSVNQATRIMVPQVVIGTVTIPAVRVPVTQLFISPVWPLDTKWLDAASIVIGYGLQEAGTLTTALKPTIDPGDPLDLLGAVEAPPDGTAPGNFIAADNDGNASALAGGVDFAARTLTPSQGSALAAPLRNSPFAYANVVAATRGETVPYELLGIGDGSIANQAFKLKNKPLTYVNAPTAADPSGTQSTLTIWVRGIRWREVRSFFGAARDDEVYVVRQDDKGDSTATFGDGVRGARLPAGAEVTACYRHGAGAAAPPAGGIAQLAKPVKGLTSVKNPVAAAGGADAETAQNIQNYAPRSALVFGRVVSIADMEALAASQPGVIAVSADWAWDAKAQQPVAQVCYIGPAAIAPTLRKSLRGACAPSVTISANPATAVQVDLGVDVRVDPRHQAATVKADVLAALTAPGTGLLSPERIGIGKPLYRSAILAAVLDVEGAASVAGLLWNGVPFDPYGQLPGSGCWFSVNLDVTTAEAANV